MRCRVSIAGEEESINVHKVVVQSAILREGTGKKHTRETHGGKTKGNTQERSKKKDTQEGNKGRKHTRETMEGNNDREQSKKTNGLYKNGNKT